MTDQQINLLLKLTRDEAELLLENNEYYLYRTLQNRLLSLVRDCGLQLPLHSLQFLYYLNGLSQRSRWY